MPSLTNWLYLTAFVLVAYWVHAGYRTLVAKGKQAQFRLEQRRRAGIPDSDTRPFDIAQAEAAQARRRKSLASSSRLKHSSSSSGISASPFRPSASSRRIVQQAASPLPPPGQSTRYDPQTYKDQKSQDATLISPPTSSASASSWQPSVMVERRLPSQLSRPSRLSQDEDDIVIDERSDEEDDMDDTPPQGPSRDEVLAATRGRKRGASEARDLGEEDSVIAHRYTNRKRPAYDSDDTTVDQDMDNVTEQGTSTARQSSSIHRGAKRSLEEVSMSRVGDTSDEEEDELMADEEDEDEEVEVPRQRSRATKIAARPTKRKAAKRLAIRGTADRSLRDEMQDLDEGEELKDRDIVLSSASDVDGADQDDDFDDSMRSIRSRRSRPASSVSSKRLSSKAAARDVSDSERNIGEEWTDTTNGLQWRMDEDDVMTEEETSKGTKRRVKVKRRVKRRLTVRREMKSRWDMPADSLHPDAGELVPHYVPVWLSEAEFRDAEARGQLGFQAGEAEKAEGSSSPRSTPLRSTPSGRNLDALFYQPSSSLPLRSSPLSRSTTPLRLGREASPANVSGTPRRSRLSLAGTALNSPNVSNGSGPNSGTSSPSGIKPRVLDTAAKRRREEELLRKLKQSKEVDRVASASLSAPSDAGIKAEPRAVSFNVPATTGNKSDTAAPKSSGFSFGNSAEPAPKPATPASPFSFGKSDKPDEPASKPPATASPFSLGPAPAADKPKEDGEKKPASTASPGSFSFGAPAAAPKADPPKPGFNFGSAPAPAKEETKAAPAPAPFAFGSISSEKAPAPASPAPFAFGSKSNENAAPAASPAPASFTFGSKSSENAPSAPSSAAPTFTFGAPSAAQPASKPAVPFTFGAAAPASSSSTNAPPKASFTFGAPAAAGGAGAGGFTFNLGKK